MFNYCIIEDDRLSIYKQYSAPSPMVKTDLTMHFLYFKFMQFIYHPYRCL